MTDLKAVALASDKLIRGAIFLTIIIFGAFILLC